jgi:hypothetical protein
MKNDMEAPDRVLLYSKVDMSWDGHDEDEKDDHKAHKKEQDKDEKENEHEDDNIEPQPIGQ